MPANDAYGRFGVRSYESKSDVDAQKAIKGSTDTLSHVPLALLALIFYWTVLVKSVRTKQGSNVGIKIE